MTATSQWSADPTQRSRRHDHLELAERRLRRSDRQQRDPLGQDRRLSPNARPRCWCRRRTSSTTSPPRMALGAVRQHHRRHRVAVAAAASTSMSAACRPATRSPSITPTRRPARRTPSRWCASTIPRCCRCRTAQPREPSDTVDRHRFLRRHGLGGRADQRRHRLAPVMVASNPSGTTLRVLDDGTAAPPPSMRCPPPRPRPP